MPRLGKASRQAWAIERGAGTPAGAKTMNKNKGSKMGDTAALDAPFRVFP